MSALAQLVPSLQMEAFGFDEGGQTLLARLRGLSPNHVLVLVNGKRRHTTANLAVDSGSPYQGGAGVDLNFIPLDAIRAPPYNGEVADNAFPEETCPARSAGATS